MGVPTEPIEPEKVSKSTVVDVSVTLPERVIEPELLAVVFTVIVPPEPVEILPLIAMSPVEAVELYRSMVLAPLSVILEPTVIVPPA